MILMLLIAFFSLVSLLALHELGHFILAKKFGVKVEEFGIGLPPRIIGKKIGETIYSINLLPLGAFVKLYGEEAGGKKGSRSFSQKPIWQRSLIILGGVFSFWIISAILLSIIYGIGAPSVIKDDVKEDLINPRVQIVVIAKNSPAESAGLKIGDIIKKMEVEEEEMLIDKTIQVQEFSNLYKGEEIILTIERGKEVFDANLIPRVNHPEQEGAMGVTVVRIITRYYPWYEAPFH